MALQDANELFSNPMWNWMMQDVTAMQVKIADHADVHRYLNRQIDRERAYVGELEARLEAMEATVNRMMLYYPTQTVDTIQQVIGTHDYLNNDLERLLEEAETEAEEGEQPTDWFDEFFQGL